MSYLILSAIMLLSINNAQNNVILSAVMPSVTFIVVIDMLRDPFYYYYPECLNTDCDHASQCKQCPE